MPVRVRQLTDPACSWSWAAEPFVRRLQVEFGDELEWTYVMGGLERDYASRGPDGLAWLIAHWLDVADETRAPIDARLWREGPIASTYPACMAVRAASEQALDAGAAYLRALREGLLCFRRKLDTTEALVEEARRVRLDVERFRIDLGSHAIVEAFGEDLEEVRSVPERARLEGAVKGSGAEERVPFPTLIFLGEGGERRCVFGYVGYDMYREAAEAAGARPTGDPKPDVMAALGRFGRMTAREVEEVCGLAQPHAAGQLWSLAAEWRVRPIQVGTGHLWEPA